MARKWPPVRAVDQGSRGSWAAPACLVGSDGQPPLPDISRIPLPVGMTDPTGISRELDRACIRPDPALRPRRYTKIAIS